MRTFPLLLISLLATILLLLVVAIILWVVQSSPVLTPTPTPTATPAPLATPTPDFRATQVAEDFLTQEAFQSALPLPTYTDVASTSPAGDQAPAVAIAPFPYTPTPSPTATPFSIAAPIINRSNDPPTIIPTPTENIVVAPPAVTSTLESTPTGSMVTAPLITNQRPPTATETPSPTDTAVAVAVAPTETPTGTPTPTATPTETPTVVAVPPTSTPTQTLPPPSETPTPIPTVPNYQVTSLNTIIIPEDGLDLRAGPSNIYTTTAHADKDDELEIRGRDVSGEWVYICCIDDTAGWARQAYAPPVNNELPDDLADDNDEDGDEAINPDDVRWLPVQSLDSAYEPLPAATPIAGNDYPLYRYDAANQARVPAAPRSPIEQAFNPAQAAQALISPVIVVGNSVLVFSADNHLYSFDRLGGNQRWRYDFGEEIRNAPAVHNGYVYAAGSSGKITALEDQGNSTTLVWSNALGLPAVSSFNTYSGTLYVAAADDSTARVHAIAQESGLETGVFTTTGSTPQFPTIGNQLVFIGNDNIVAVDVAFIETVWISDTLDGVGAPPLYSSPGVAALAELFVADRNGRLYNLDANTGKTIWSYEGSEPITGMTGDDSMVYASGAGFIKGIERKDGEEKWRRELAGEVMGGPIASAGQLIVLTQGGSIYFIDPSSNTLINSNSVGTSISGAGAVSGEWLFVPGSNGNMYGYKSVSQ